MMKKFLLSVLSAFVLVSCVQEWMPEETPVEEGLVQRTWTVAMHDGTRATLDDNLYPVWEVGEELSVYDHVAQVGRIFTVESVDGGIATITGTISAGGDTPFDAVYPAKSAGEWTSDGTAPLKLPETQYIPAGRNVCPDVLVSTAHSDVPDGVIGFHNISSLLKVTVDREGIADIRIDLVGASEDAIHSYKAGAESGSLAKGTYFIAVDPGTYGGGLQLTCSDRFGQGYRKSSTKPLEAGIGGLLNLGAVSDGKPWRYYNITETKPYGNQQALLEETGLMDNMGDIQSWLPYIFPDRNKPASAISYTYLSADPKGNPVELSARLYIPDAALNGTKGLTGICLTNHGTMASNAECPTMRAQFEGALAWKNYAMVMPDYYGFGVSADRPQAYLDAETTARGNIDAYLAARQLLEDREVTIPQKLYSFGYSQGGFNSMANLKYVSQHPELGLSFQKVMCGGSPFDVELTWNEYALGNFHNSLAFVPMTLVSINETQELGISYGDIFKGELLANYEEWILSKKYTTSQINSLISPDSENPVSLSDILNDDFMAGRGSAFNAFMDVCRRYSLTSGWTPPSETKIFLFHSKEDDTVPYDNLTAMKAFLDEVAPDSYTATDGSYGGHVDAVVYFVISIISEW
jgi:pimeloyl-ACP methyl ester carboxylesterase